LDAQDATYANVILRRLTGDNGEVTFSVMSDRPGGRGGAWTADEGGLTIPMTKTSDYSAARDVFSEAVRLVGPHGLLAARFAAHYAAMRGPNVREEELGENYARLLEPLDPEGRQIAVDLFFNSGLDWADACEMAWAVRR
jgi:hypothetical protein